MIPRLERESAPRSGLNIWREPDFRTIKRGTEFDFAGEKERIITWKDFSLDDARKALPGVRFGVLGYGVQGPAQSLDLRDNGFPVIIGQRERYAKPGEKPTSWEKAITDGWIPGKTLFSDLTEVVRRSNFIMFLLSDAGQVDVWPTIMPHFKSGDTLQYSHGCHPDFWQEEIFPSFIDVSLLAPKGAGRTVRENYLSSKGTNCSIAVMQDASGKALERTVASARAIGAGFIFSTSGVKEGWSDQTGERGSLMGAFKGLIDAAYDNLREIGLTPKEAALHTVEITTQTISRIIGEKGADGLIKENLPNHLKPYFAAGFAAAKTAVEPVFDDLYEKVSQGIEARRAYEENRKPDYADKLREELKVIEESELGQVSADIRKERLKGPTVPDGITNKNDAIIAGALVAIFHAQCELFKRKGHSWSEAVNETIEEATKSLYPLVDENGIPWMFAHCSTTAQRGALDWNRKFRDVLAPSLRTVYRSEDIEAYPRVLDDILNSKIWKASITVRQLRPENQKIA